MPEMNYLGDNNKADIAWKMIRQEQSPGWLFMVENENSTLGESLYLNSMGSAHHPFSACIGSWFYMYLGGIRPDTNNPGFKKFIIKPELKNTLTWVKSSHESMFGTINSDWKKDGKKMQMNITVPANTTAEVYVPTSDSNSITENGKSIDKNQNIKFIRTETDYAVYLIGSGNYKFKSNLK